MMPIRSRAAAAAVHILTALCAAVGVVLQCGFIGGKLNLAVLQYFTLMTYVKPIILDMMCYYLLFKTQNSIKKQS